MPARAQVNERSTAYLKVDFKDKTGAPVAPAGVSFTVLDVASGTTLRGPVSVGAAASVEITLVPDDTKIVDSTNRLELRRVVVVATYGASDQQTEQYDFEVRNLSIVS